MSEQKIQKLKSFAVGNNIRLIQTDERLLHAYNFKIGKNLNVDIYDESLSGHYLMKDKKNLALDRTFTDDFIEFVSGAVNDNKSEVYYNTNDILIGGNPIKLIQSNDKAYIIDNEKFNDTTKSYTLDQWADKTNEVQRLAYDILSAYVSTTYKENYFDDSHYVNNKAVPIYCLDNRALNDLKYIRLFDKDTIDRIVSKYDVVQSISGEVLFNSKEQKMDTVNYDAILIDPIINAYAEDFEMKGSEIEPLFEDIFTNIPKESFYRFLNPIGLMTDVHLKGNVFKEAQYTYSLSMKEKSESPSVNYFSMKNLKNPEDYQDYYLFENEEFKSVKSPNYVYEYNLISNIFKAYDEVVVNELYNYMNEFDLYKISGKLLNGEITTLGSHDIVTSNGVMNDVINIALEYQMLSDRDEIKTAFKNIINNGDHYGADLLRHAWNTFLYRNFITSKLELPKVNYDDETKYEVEQYDNETNHFLIFEDDFINKITEQMNEFKKCIDVLLKSLGISLKLDNIIFRREEEIFIDNQRLKKLIRTKLHFDNGYEVLRNELKRYDSSLSDDAAFHIAKMTLRYKNFVKVCQMLGEFILDFEDFIKNKNYGNPSVIVKTGILQNIFDHVKVCSLKEDIENVHSNAIRETAVEEGLFKCGIYYGNISDLMKEIAKINSEDHERHPEMSLMFPEKYLAKIDDYMSTYEDMFERENEMPMSGILYGNRQYNDAFVDLQDGLNFVYKYTTRIDENFLNDVLQLHLKRIDEESEYLINGEDEDEQSQIERLSNLLLQNNLCMVDNEIIVKFVLKDLNDYVVFDESESALNTTTLVQIAADLVSAWNKKTMHYMFKVYKDFNKQSPDLVDCILFRVSPTKTMVTMNRNLVSFLNMMDEMSRIEFVDNVRGQHYYKENIKQKSNVFSLNVRNSGLDYKIYSYDEMKLMCTKLLGKNFEEYDKRYEKENILKELSLGKITTNKFITEYDYPELKYYYYEKTGDFYKDKDEMMRVGKVIKTKMQLREAFEDAIRKSIHRYMPVNTVLWKIKYTED